MTETTPSPYIEDTKQWIEKMVIGLNLCPFAKRVFQGDGIRYVLSTASEGSELLLTLATELKRLNGLSREASETTLVVHPFIFEDFLDFNDFVGIAESLVEDLGLSGEIQLASFHPKYQFSGTTAESVENYTNRSPYPTLHLLREASISELLLSDAELAAIPERNIENLKSLGLKAIKARFGS
jgi:uncharacterized protein